MPRCINVIDLYRNTETRVTEFPAAAITNELLLPFDPRRVAFIAYSGGTSFIFPRPIVDATIFGIPVNQQTEQRFTVNHDGIIVTGEWYYTLGAGNGIGVVETLLTTGDVYTLLGQQTPKYKKCRFVNGKWIRG